ncbi:uncharacterized protein LOC131255105 [Magnolia sinica]|uniref:uncharacterized protein LOC131255105 n=1 Tax=Magnolia sinica TaxID=86752 RepID=UPI0026598E29|nr:uncharacterized protein LOC131255105 [Magnolia sinica]
MLEILKGVAEWELTVELQEEPAFCLQINEVEPLAKDQPWYTGIKCQEHASQIHVPVYELYNLTAPWPFSVWGLDIIGKISPKASNRHEYILVAVDYFTKWIEATSYTTIAASHVVKFMKNNIISRHGLPHAIITDNGTPFINKRMIDFLNKFKIQHYRSSPYRPQMNGGVEAANKIIIHILEKMVKTCRDWSEMLPYALWAYRMSVRSATGATPYELTYGMEAVLPIEIEIYHFGYYWKAKSRKASGNKQDMINCIWQMKSACGR